MEEVTARAISLADAVARAMHHYPYVMRTAPPYLLDIDVAFSRTRNMPSPSFHVPATHPREESVGVDWARI